MKKTEDIDGPQALLSEAQAAQVLWEYYKKHKLELISDICAHRDALRALLMQGVAAEVAFARFQHDATPVLHVPSKMRSSTRRRATTPA